MRRTTLSKKSSATESTLDGVRSRGSGDVSLGCRWLAVEGSCPGSSPAEMMGSSSGRLGGVGSTGAPAGAAGSGTIVGEAAGSGDDAVGGASDTFQSASAASYARRSAVSNAAAFVVPRPRLRRATSRRATARQPVGSRGAGGIVTSATVRVPWIRSVGRPTTPSDPCAQPRRLSPGSQPYRSTGPRPRASSSARSCSGVPASSGKVP